MKSIFLNKKAQARREIKKETKKKENWIQAVLINIINIINKANLVYRTKTYYYNYSENINYYS